MACLIFTAFVALTLHSPQLYDNKHMRKDSVYIIILYFLNTTIISVFFLVFFISCFVELVNSKDKIEKLF